MKTFTFKNNLLKFMLLMITAFTTGNLFAQQVTFDAPVGNPVTTYAGGSLSFTGNRSGTYNDPGPNDYLWTWSALPAAGVSFSGTNPQSTTDDPITKTVTFANAGTYTITLTVTRGTSSAQTTKTVVVLASPAPTAPGNPTASPVTCVDGGTVLLANPCASDAFSARFVGGVHLGTTGGADGLSQGAVWRYANITNNPTPSDQTNAQITVEYIYQARLDAMDDDGAANEAGNPTTETAGWFAPRIDPDQSLGTTSRLGFVQFKIEFFQESALTNADYVVPKALLGINYSHRDIDGTRSTGNYNFRETGLLKNPAGASLLKNVPTELTDYAYNDIDGNWQGVAGSVCNRNQTSRYAEVAASFVYPGTTPKTSLTFRMGYDYQRLQAGGATYGDQDARLYASVFNCFNFPTVTETTLPVKYSFFNAKREGNDVKLAWQTATETNNLGFQIERRVATGEWKSIGFSNAKSAHGNSSTPINYEFTDANNTEKGVIQYRLKQMDYDMRFAYSDVRAVRGMGVKAGLLIYPNPSTDGKVNIVFEDKNSAVDVSLSDMNGRTIKQWRKVTTSALQITNLTPGMYTLRIVNNESGEQTVEKIMVNNR